AGNSGADGEPGVGGSGAGGTSSTSIIGTPASSGNAQGSSTATARSCFPGFFFRSPRLRGRGVRYASSQASRPSKRAWIKNNAEPDRQGCHGRQPRQIDKPARPVDNRDVGPFSLVDARGGLVHDNREAVRRIHP